MTNKLEKIMTKAVDLQEKISIVHTSVEWLERRIDDVATRFDDLKNGFHDDLSASEKQKININLHKEMRHLLNRNKMEAKLLDSLESEMQDIDVLLEELSRAKKEK
jgi:hypothetical protein